MLNINDMIKHALITKQINKLRVYRAIKTEIMNFKTSKQAKEYTEDAEINLLKGMCKQHKDSIQLYLQANREDLVAKERMELEILESLLPSPKPISEIKLEFLRWWRNKKINNENFSNKYMGQAIKYLKAQFPYNEGKDISNIVKKYYLNMSSKY